MTHFLIHVGPHKTGSSYIQEHLASLRPDLQSQGVLYPKNWGPVAHHRLFERLSAATPDLKLEAEFAELHASGFEQIVISVEGLANLPEAKVQYMKKLLSPAQVSIIYYVRSWGDLLLSLWKEELKAARIVQTLPEYLCWRMVNPKVSLLMNFGPALDNFAAAFGKDSIKLVSYDRVVMNKMDMFGHFSRTFLGLKGLPRKTLDRVNVSPNTFDTEIIRAFAAIEWRQRGAEPPVRYFAALREKYMQIRNELAGSKLLDGMRQCEAEVPVSEISENLLSLHQALFEQFEYALVAPKGKRFFFPPRRVPLPFIRPDYLMLPGVADELVALHSRLAQGLDTAPKSPPTNREGSKIELAKSA